MNSHKRYVQRVLPAVLALLGAWVCVPEAVLAQSSAQLDAQSQQMVSLIEAALNVMALLVFGAILLIARRDMTGWNQPIKEVWFSFSGRLNRKAYWLKGLLPIWMVGAALQILGTLVGLVLGGSDFGAAVGGIGLLLVFVPYLALSVWVGLGLTIKRYHDLGMSGWWIFGALIPFYNIWLAIKLWFLRGSVGPNAYGPDPIDPIHAYIEETYGEDGLDDDGGGAEKPVHPRPRAPDPDPEPKGFGLGKIIKPKKAEPASVEPEAQDAAPVPDDLPGGEANIELIKNRLGADILRPIPPTRGGKDD